MAKDNTTTVGNPPTSAPTQYQQQVARTTDRILLVVMGMLTYGFVANIYYGALNTAAIGIATFGCLAVALVLHRTGQYMAARFIMLTALNLSAFVGSYFMPQNSNLSMFLLSYIGLPFMVMGWWENRPLMVYFCALPLVLWITLMATNFGDGRYFELSPEITSFYGYGHSVIVFAAIAAQFIYYGRVTRQYSLALRESLSAQEQANEAKTAFLRSMSHEMRTPLGAILGASDLLRNQSNSPDAAEELARIIATSGNDLLSLTEKSMSFARITAGDLSPRPETVELKVLMARIIDRFKDKIDSKSIRLTLTENAPSDHVFADPGMLTDVLTQVFENALTYTPEQGAVTLSLHPGPAADMLRLSFTDTGPGIAAKHHEAVFEPFERLNQTYGTQSGGGVGLTIARAYLQAMGGHIALEEVAEEGGTRVLIDLPLAAA